MTAEPWWWWTGFERHYLFGDVHVVCGLVTVAVGMG
jgi:hypothetical protein